VILETQGSGSRFLAAKLLSLPGAPSAFKDQDQDRGAPDTQGRRGAGGELSRINAGAGAGVMEAVPPAALGSRSSICISRRYPKRAASSRHYTLLRSPSSNEAGELTRRFAMTHYFEPSIDTPSPWMM